VARSTLAVKTCSARLDLKQIVFGLVQSRLILCELVFDCSTLVFQSKSLRARVVRIHGADDVPYSEGQDAELLEPVSKHSFIPSEQ